MNNVADAKDSFSIGYTALAFLLILSWAARRELLLEFNSELPALLLLLLLSIAALGWCVLLLLNVISRRWKRAISIFVAPCVAYALCWTLAEIGLDAQRAHFEIRKPFYQREISRLPAGVPRFKLFPWGDLGFAAAITLYSVIYDESDEIALPSDQRSSEWLRRTAHLCPGTQLCTILHPEAGHRMETRKMAEHFYVVTEWYE